MRFHELGKGRLSGQCGPRQRKDVRGEYHVDDMQDPDVNDRQKRFIGVSDQSNIEYTSGNEVRADLFPPEQSSGRAQDNGAPEDTDVFEFFLDKRILFYIELYKLNR